ncbi:hypothetical protein ACFX2I_030252 [Malus domestica]
MELRDINSQIQQLDFDSKSEGSFHSGLRIATNIVRNAIVKPALVNSDRLVSELLVHIYVEVVVSVRSKSMFFCSNFRIGKFETHLKVADFNGFSSDGD